MKNEDPQLVQKQPKPVRASKTSILPPRRIISSTQICESLRVISGMVQMLHYCKVYLNMKLSEWEVEI